jgi:predicted  nucleic acid-binding Zn-ribbon protein
MGADERMLQLHDKATRGLALTDEEQSQLDAWYAAQDAAESELLSPVVTPPSLAALQNEIDAAVAQLNVAARQIQELSSANAVVRQEIAVLQQRLAQTAPAV